MRRYLKILCLLFIYTFVLVSAVLADAGDDRIAVTCTTTNIAAILEAIGGDKVTVTTVIPFGMCPGHFDISPGEVMRIRNADIVIFHGYERFMKDLTKDAKGKTDYVKVEVSDNWIIPDVHIKAVRAIETILSSRFPGSAVYFSANAERYIRQVEDAGARLAASLKPLKGHPVIASSMNTDFIQWTGLKTVSTFGRDEDISLKELKGVVESGSRDKAGMVIDNLQSSGKTGRAIADELNIPVETLSNFPEEAAGRYYYIRTLEENCAKIINTLAKFGE